ncbi:MAG TPA: cupin domain-containing protein [Chloroflexota bacterium]|nr:cupin domain-containing protein [Chloroflexota bacterium]
MAKQLTTYVDWMQKEGIPIVGGHGVTDIMALQLGDWERLGGRGAYLQLVGLEGLTGMYVGEVPPGGTLKPEKHMFDELIYVVSGRGSTEVWDGEIDSTGRRRSFAWQAGSLFSPPANTWHRFFNGSGSEPARFLSVNTEPIVMDLFHSPDFVFNCDYQFNDRYNGQSDYFKVGERRFDSDSRNPRMVWETNFIPDVPGASLDKGESKGPGNLSTHYEMSGNVLAGHMTEWPVGRYH